MAKSVGELQEQKNEQAIKELQKFQDGLYNKLLSYLAGITQDGFLQPNTLQLAQLENAIVNWTKELNYGNIIENYLSALGEVDELNVAYYSKETSKRYRQRIENEILRSPLTNEYREQVSNNLRSAGAYNEIVKKVADTLKLQALRGMTFEQAAEQLKALVTNTETGQGIAERHFNQVARDAIMQYDGVIQEGLAKEFNPTRGRYLASVIETTRPICDHIKDKYGNGYITKQQLKEILDEFCPGGQPSKEKITYTTVSGEERRTAKGAGMIEGTTVDNFPSYRGGYNCRHEWRWDFSTAEI